eukprot:gnl/TRDRNA2_/TRDRNA2_165676_c1_seq4.p1 gnl/TRDRNA2_/TRDRNA2_165676_c1~~gnl/TRDRNA2_/TRDRNA2_165676_c1_seq4.p1  ORF type:complete len:339 (+),score=42.22 gnl/TRDRNA2_/TRDRNA2_165676_c1_seq4:96-1112(+)
MPCRSISTIALLAAVVQARTNVLNLWPKKTMLPKISPVSRPAMWHTTSPHDVLRQPVRPDSIVTKASRPQKVKCVGGVCFLEADEVAESASDGIGSAAPSLRSTSVAPLDALLGAQLQGRYGRVDTGSALSDAKAIGLYFSASFCLGCKFFTPDLSKAYLQSLKAKGLEIVYVSSDETESEFRDYHEEMPWLALPFDARDTKEALMNKFHIKSLPQLVILDMNGNLITADGRAKVRVDPRGEDFPWKPKAVRSFAETYRASRERSYAPGGREAIFARFYENAAPAAQPATSLAETSASMSSRSAAGLIGLLVGIALSCSVFHFRHPFMNTMKEPLLEV